MSDHEGLRKLRLRVEAIIELAQMQGICSTRARRNGYGQQIVRELRVVLASIDKLQREAWRDEPLLSVLQALAESQDSHEIEAFEDPDLRARRARQRLHKTG